MTIEFLKENNLILLEVISGSKSFGIASEKSDTDIKGVFYLPKNDFYGMGYIPQIANETNDIVYYEVGRFVELLLKNNPNILEVLATPEEFILFKHPIMSLLNLEDFLSKLCKDTFGGYAVTQIQKARGLKKKIVSPVENERKDVLDFCKILDGSKSIPVKEWLHKSHLKQEYCGLTNIPHSKGIYGLFYNEENKFNYRGIYKNEDSNEVSLSSIPKGETLKAYLYFNQDAYSIHCKEHKEYWKWMKERNQDRFDTNLKHGKNYDSKNMMHTIRLLQSAVSILETGKLDIQVPNREELLDIKKGKLEYDDLIVKTEELMDNMNKAILNSKLPDFPDKIKINDLLISIRKNLYK